MGIPLNKDVDRISELVFHHLEVRGTVLSEVEQNIVQQAIYTAYKKGFEDASKGGE
jgi:hypothetical protein